MVTVEDKALDRLRIPVRRSDIARLLEADGQLTSEERELRDRLADERALDLGIPDMPHYGRLFEALASHADFGRRFRRLLWHPEEILGVTWPLNSTDVSRLLGEISDTLACSARTVDRLADDELITAPLLIGLGEERPLRVYFARHFVEIAYWQLHDLTPARERARLQAFRRDLDGPEEIFWSDHPSLPTSALGRGARPIA